MTRDGDRARVYDAEAMVFDETLFSEPLGPAGILDLTDRFLADPWWQRNGVPFTVAPTRRESAHSWARSESRTDSNVATAQIRRSQIRLSLQGEDAATLAHEAAHLLGDRHAAHPAHGALFRRAEVDVVAVVCGSIAAGRLDQAFADANLDLADRDWTEPTGVTDRGIYGRWRTERLQATTPRS